MLNSCLEVIRAGEWVKASPTSCPSATASLQAHSRLQYDSCQAMGDTSTAYVEQLLNSAWFM